MNMNNLNNVFSENFKFEINEEVRHRGDTKSYTADMGLLILTRLLVEGEDDDGVKVYEKLYHCRMIRFSGSGDINRFSEKELMTIKEYEEKKMKDDFERNQMREDMKKTEKEIMELFDINKEDYVYLKDENGNVDKSRKFRMCGFSVSGTEIKLSLRESILTINNSDVKRDSAEVKSKDEFEKIK